MLNNNLQQYVLAEGKSYRLTGLWAHWEEAKRENSFQCYKLQGLCTTTFGKEETVQMHQLEK